MMLSLDVVQCCVCKYSGGGSGSDGDGIRILSFIQLFVCCDADGGERRNNITQKKREKLSWKSGAVG